MEKAVVTQSMSSVRRVQRWCLIAVLHPGRAQTADMYGRKKTVRPVASPHKAGNRKIITTAIITIGQRLRRMTAELTRNITACVVTPGIIAVGIPTGQEGLHRRRILRQTVHPREQTRVVAQVAEEAETNS